MSSNWNARVRQVIETELTHRGDGSDGNPNRIILQYWSFDGELLAEVDREADGLPDPMSEVEK